MASLPAEQDGRSPGRRWRVLLGAAALVVLLLGVVVTLSTRSDQVAAPPPTPAATGTGATTVTPSPPATLLAGFTDCSDAVGRPAQCGPRPPQCWGGLISNADSPYLATPVRCSRNHVYQTFAAAPLSAPVNRQSQLDGSRAARAVCTASLVNAMLPRDEQRKDWEVYAIPAQSAADDEGYFRCVFGRGERSEPLDLSPPG